MSKYLYQKNFKEMDNLERDVDRLVRNGSELLGARP